MKTARIHDYNHLPSAARVAFHAFASPQGRQFLRLAERGAGLEQDNGGNTLCGDHDCRTVVRGQSELPVSLVNELRRPFSHPVKVMA